jgi:hypothetical protein
LETGFIGIAPLARGPNSYAKQFNAMKPHPWKADSNLMPQQAYLFQMSKPTNIKLKKVLESTQRVPDVHETDDWLYK